MITLMISHKTYLRSANINGINIPRLLNNQEIPYTSQRKRKRKMVKKPLENSHSLFFCMNIRCSTLTKLIFPLFDKSVTNLQFLTP